MTPVARNSIPVFFIVSALLLQCIYLFQFSTLTNYAHGGKRFFHVVHLAYSMLGDTETLPVSMLKTISHIQPELINISVANNISAIPCQKEPHTRPYCHFFFSFTPEKLSFLELTAIPLEPEKRFTYSSSKMAGQFPVIGYLPYLPGALVGVLFQLSPILIMYLSLMGNALIVITLGYYTLRILPVMRWSVCFLLLVPMSCLLRVFFMPDALALDLCLFMMAVALRLYYTPQLLSRRQQTWLAAVAVAAAVTKLFYCLVPAFLLVAPARCFGGQIQKYRWIIVTLFISILTSILWGAYVAYAYYPAMAFRLGETLEGQRSFVGQAYFILQHPIAYIRAVANNFIHAITLMGWHIDVFTYGVPWASYGMFVYILLCPIWLLPLFADQPLTRNKSFGIRQRWIWLVLLLLSVYLLYTIRFLYIIMPLDWHINHGFHLQARYWLPLVAFFPVLWHGLVPVSSRVSSRFSTISAWLVVACLAYLHCRQLQDTVQVHMF